MPLPGTDPWNQIVQTPPTWQFRFFSVQNVPEMLIAGHQLQYLKWFHNSEAVNSHAFTNEGEETYARVYATRGAAPWVRVLPGLSQRRQSQSEMKCPIARQTA